ncbi:MAG: leucine-rich repeat domain-containing protein, partial [Clostridia bacterium]|nr:leucine-rich repeat domain-containing protein [Clostridia bacterium]
TFVPVVEKLVFASTIESEYLAINFAKDNLTLKEVYFENGSAIKDLNEGCFMFCYNLATIKLPDDLTSIPYWAFHCCLSLETIELPDTITTISYQAFFGCENLLSIVFPQGLIHIDSGAFCCCTSLESITLPSTVFRLGDYAFEGCTSLKNVELPEDLTRIGIDVFKNTPYAENSGFEDDSEELPEQEEMSGFVVSESKELVSYVGEETDVIVPEGVTLIGEYAFKNRSDITSVKLPKSLLKISGYSFYGCTGITEFVVPDTVQEIDRCAFAGMCNLEKLTVPFIGKSKYLSGEVQTDDDNIKWWLERTQEKCSVCKGELCDSVDIPNRSYDVCKPRSFIKLTITKGNSENKITKYSLKNFGVKEVTLGKGVYGIQEYGLAEANIEIINFAPDTNMSVIESYAFYKNKIKRVVLPDNIAHIKECAFAENEIVELNLNEGLISLEGFERNKLLTTVKIPRGVKSIGRNAFLGCRLLENIEIPEGVESIAVAAFGATGIKEIVLPESLVYIARSAFLGSKIERIVLPERLNYLSAESFYRCEFLKEVVIGGSVEEISSSAFADCSSLETVVIPDSVKAISDDAFTNSTEKLVIYCNEGSYAQQYAVQNNIKYTTLVLEAIPNQTYTGKAIEPEVKAKANNKQLTLDKEYKVSFADNVESGVSSVTAKGLGDFKHLVAKGKFNILPRQLNDVVVNYYNIAYYTPSGVKPKLSLCIGETELVEGEHYEVLGLDKVKNVGVYNISISGNGNLSGTKNFTLEVLPRSITVTKIVSTGDIKVTDSQYTLVEGVDYKVEKRTDENGATRTYVVGIGNYTDETRLSIPNNTAEPTGILKILKMLLNLFSLLFGMFRVK